MNIFDLYIYMLFLQMLNQHDYKIKFKNIQN